MEAMDVYRQWLEDPAIDEETKAELRGIEGDEKEIEDRFYRGLEFGTAGLRGVIGAGTNRMNKYTVGRATQGLADYINKACPEGASVAIACDSRHMSPEFVAVSASVLNANGIKTYVFDRLRPTPELSYVIRRRGCISGINITASHNPAEYNGYKVYWADGAQVTPPHDTGIMECVEAVPSLTAFKEMPREEAEAQGLYVEIGEEDDEAYIATILGQIKAPEAVKQCADSLKIVYTPLHGTGITIVPEALRRAGFKNIYIVKEQEVPDGAFPTVKYPNPEMPEAFALADKLGKEVDADLIIATDPDADRIGVHLKDSKGEYHALTGNMIGALLCDYELSRRAEKGTGKDGLPADGFVVRSIVSGRMTDAICANYNAELVEVLTGFKHIGAKILKAEETGVGTFLFGFEESYGFLTGDYARDKDACGPALVLAEAAAYYKLQGITPWEAFCALYEKYGYFMEKTVSITKPGKDGLQEIADTMKRLRENPPAKIGDFEIKESRDYNDPDSTGLPKSNVLYYGLGGGDWVTVRPSGTEPKIKYYMGVKADSGKEAGEKLERIEAAMRRLI